MTAPRALAFLALGYLALVCESSLKAAIGAPLHLPTPEVMLLIVLYLGLRGRGAAAQLVGFALVAGSLAALFAGSPKGLFALTLAVSVLCARAASNRLMVATPWQVAAISAAATLAHSLVVYLLSSMYTESFGSLRLLPGVALFPGLLAPVVFALLRRLDRRFLTDPRRLKMASA